MLVNSSHTVFIFDDLKKTMTKKFKAQQDNNRKYIANHASPKASLNKGILDKSWHLLEIFMKYTAYRAGKDFFKISAQHTSHECAD